MASANRIDSIYDVAAIAAEQAKVEALVKESIESIRQAKAVSIDFNVNTKSLDDYNRKIAELEKKLAGLNRAVDAATKSSTLLAKQKEAEARAAEAAAKATIAETKAKEALTKVSENATKQMANEQKLIDEVTNDYLQLSKAYNDAAMRAKNFALRFGEAHPITQEAIADARAMGDTLKRLDAAVGQHQRNVGNYASAFNGLGFSFTQVARELPSLTIGFQTFALAISNNLPMVIDEIAKTKTEIAALKAEGKTAPSLLSQVGKSLLSWQVGLSVGIALFTAYAGQLKSWAVELFSGKKGTDELAEAQKKLADAIRDVNAARQESITFNTQANNAALQTLTTELQVAEARGASEMELLDIREKIALERKAIADNELAHQITIAEKEKDSRDLQKTGLDAVKTALSSAQIAYFTYTDEIISLSNKRSHAIAMDDEDTAESLEKQIAAAKAGQAAAKERADGYIRTLDAVNDADAALLVLQEQREEERLRLAREQRAFEAEALAARLESQAEGQAEQIGNERLSYAERMAALVKYTQLKKEIIDNAAAQEKDKKNITEAEITAIEAKAQADRVALARQANALINGIEVEAREGRQKKLDDQQKETDKSWSDMRTAGDEVLDAQIDRNEKEVKATEKSNEEKEKLEKARLKKEAELVKKRHEVEAQIAAETQGFIFDLFEGRIEREKNLVQEQIDALELQKQKDIEVANQTITNAADKANAIAVIEARAQAKKEALEMRQRELDQKKARYEKARAVAEITQGTAIAVINALGSKPWTPANIALAVAVGALGAVQIARTLAQPIPKYAEGTGNHPGGAAIVGDAGRAEGIVLPDGSVYRTPATSTLVDLPRGAKVFPDYSTMPTFNVKAVDTTDELKRGFNQVVGAIKRIPQPIIRAERAWTAAHKIGSSYRTYLNRSI